ncbi:unnamed protein product [Tilletia controversa]|uniref:triacylglycerol lipase n=1 Tax=Tilletia caries TaxID=13290 RepID=A0ABN7IHW4_9BASI|nr:hypothetical protein CF336_g1082 [Tilletia laevis]CAD6887774.1 unnamed protein product [Tilletia caries]CAD6911561.1 unnamed protein product [Tilletia controversa]KAE8208199.1 hypothetical protein CF335_g592 [Tilletia laevis]CAD6900653.1 unnamed protein product [Tilletia caries]
MQLAKSFVLLSAVLATAVMAAPYSQRSLEARLLFGGSDNTTAAGLPSQDAFYQPPSGWESKANGAILRSRQVKPSSSNAAAAYQILFKTTDALGAADHTVTTILVPKKPQSPSKIVSIQLPEDSASVDCAPSAAIVANSKSNFAGLIPFVNQGLEPSLQNGYYVNIPDHEGSRALVFVGPMEGHAVLDSLKAATSFPTAIPGVSIKTPIVMGGYSGGAHATAWGSQLYPSYAPTLNIIGQVIGGTPVNLTSVLNYLNKYNAYPDIKEYIDASVYPNGTALIKDIQNNKCLAQVVFDYSGKDLFSLFTTQNPLDAPVPRKRLNENLLGSNGKTLKVKTIMYHSDKDDIIPYGDAKRYATEQCAKGASINFVTDSGQSHVGEELSRADDLGKWIDAFHKGTADSSCK